MGRRPSYIEPSFNGFLPSDTPPSGESSEDEEVMERLVDTQTTPIDINGEVTARLEDSHALSDSNGGVGLRFGPIPPREFVSVRVRP